MIFYFSFIQNQSRTHLEQNSNKQTISNIYIIIIIIILKDFEKKQFDFIFLTINQNKRRIFVA